MVARVLCLASIVGVALAAVSNPCDRSYYQNVGDIIAEEAMWNVQWSEQRHNDQFNPNKVCHACADCVTDVNFNVYAPPLGSTQKLRYDPNCDFPNGFSSGLVYMDNEPPFCINIPNAMAGKSMVQVLIETNNQFDRLCVQSQGSTIVLNDGVTKEAQCGEGQVMACFPGEDTGEDLKLMVFCDVGCPETNIAFKYKILHSMARTDPKILEDPAVDSVDMWCMMQDGKDEIVFPSQLRTLYPRGVTGPIIPPKLNGASSAHVTLFSVLATVVAAVMLR